jgi:Asp-tRNA(Asn)/Glu-tRNA(Gln) amidotransferase A subunit family amidase
VPPSAPTRGEHPNSGELLRGRRPETHTRTIPLAGIRPLVPSLDHVGPLTRRVADLAIVQAVLDPAAFRRHGGDGRSRTIIRQDPSFYEDAEETVRNATAEALASCRALGAKILWRKVAARNEEFLLVTA